MRIETTDNNLGKLTITEDSYKDLKDFADIPLEVIIKKQPSLLVFPLDLANSSDRIGEESIFNIEPNKDEDTASVAPYRLKTGNLMGFIGVGETQVNITSRFTEIGKEDFFLHYMLGKVLSVDFNVLNLSATGTNNDVLNLLMFMFPNLLKQAVAQGIFRAYRTYERNNSSVKGSIDINRHIRKNIPFLGKVAYRSREFSYDNYLLELIRHTIEYIKESGLSSLLSKDEDIRAAVHQVYDATSEYRKSDRSRIIGLNVRPVAHPLYTKYTELQKLCMLILRHENMKYLKNEDKVYGILFDGAWLWEEYLATILKKEGFEHPENKNHSGGIQMFRNKDLDENIDKNFRRIYPDFYKKGQCILDAKYKQLDKGLVREDLYQVVTYMHTMSVRQGGFIFPSKNLDDNDKNVFCYELAGDGGFIRSIKVKIPQNINSQTDFNNNMKSEELKLQGLINFI
ncbi:hypothetical protein DYE50_06450 [Treponema ruminis]|uniref:5-methylcytosine-specific restriction endonuclease McrBC regulatory subunit McrC n=1 Tax=Treponema ruminis TaxID=744515 RepID=A0A7W8G9X1_9SPIR|nr:hypothetical protein [Treponema ruminis]MBB5226558.1 5-methylcytosine-specific restriction endonuclease McrBC regulatory subunit McrC [Treponema ruminis]QSI02211.1 hypothetical protein DYE50_06450 [Treponema ruminis]